jgi:hypothetical protein
VDAAPHIDRDEWMKMQRKPKARKLTPARRGEGTPSNQCPRCGYSGPHFNADNCIAALRDRLSKFE